MMRREYKDVGYMQQVGQPKSGLTFDCTLIFEEDGTAYRRIHSKFTEDFIDIAVTGSAIDYERRVLEAKQQMQEADELVRDKS